ncbi:ABC transporter ATP-binding protein [Acuticoccus kandeliae]|uniref:ABC transporter ATP-binding protein n=1 Tax=Acuticoccus kandeliae TaxID=2073160 RepID=UPI000D3EE180|nr:ABC transporter ATP-binding protein [Acuticoccus kandeliae]
MLTISDISVSFSGVKALDGVSFEAPSGRILGLIGPNGSGKSTLLNVVAGVIAPNRGRVLLDGAALPAGKPDAVAAMGVARTFQVPRLARRLTVIQNVITGVRSQPGENLATLLFAPAKARAAEREITARAFAMLDRLGLTHLANHAAGGLSGGQQKLLSIAMAIMADARTILLDEPAAGVNPVLIEQQVGLLKSLAAEGRTLILIEHNMEMVADLCDQVVVLDSGQIIAEGTPAEIRGDARVMRSYLGQAPA